MQRILKHLPALGILENHDPYIITLGIDVVKHEQGSGTLDVLQIQLLRLSAMGRPWLKLSGNL